jgi:hypothetical protein
MLSCDDSADNARETGSSIRPKAEMLLLSSVDVKNPRVFYDFCTKVRPPPFLRADPKRKVDGTRGFSISQSQLRNPLLWTDGFHVRKQFVCARTAMVCV